jgi:triacylglycerol lipase
MRLTRSTVRTIVASFAIAALAACSSSDLFGPKPRATVTTAPVRNPIVFVHGWNSSGAAWFTMIDRLKADGYTDAELYNWTYYSAQSNATTAAQLATKVDSILALTGATQVDIITHSMGALSARYYIKNLGGGSKVDAFISLGGPNHGTNTAWFCGQTACVEMRPNSRYLNSLNQGDETPGSIIRYKTWWSPCDEVINPQKSTILSGATNSQTACLRHSDLHENATVYSQVKAAL